MFKCGGESGRKGKGGCRSRRLKIVGKVKSIEMISPIMVCYDSRNMSKLRHINVRLPAET